MRRLFDNVKWWEGFAGWLELALFLVLLAPALVWGVGVFIHRLFSDEKKPQP